MANDNSSGNQTVVTLITVCGSVIVAVVGGLLTNWDKIFSTKQPISSDAPPSQTAMSFQVWGREFLLQNNTEVPAGVGRIKLRVNNLPPEKQDQLWFYIKSGGNNLYYLDKLIKSSDSEWETEGDKVQFGSVGQDGCLRYEAGVIIYDAPSTTNEYDTGLKELPGTRLGSPNLLIREPVGEQRC